MRLPLTIPPTLFVRIRGERGVREYRAVLDTGCAYCMIPRKDALDLGYPATYEPIMPDTGEGGTAVTNSYIIQVPIITLKEVSVGELVVKDLRTVAYDLPVPSGVDVVLGVNFLKNFKVTFDFKDEALIIGKA